MKTTASCFLGVIAALLMLWGCDNGDTKPTGEEASGEEPAEGKIVALGDSLTAGLGVDPDRSYPSLLQKRLVEEGHDYRVVNAGVSGETTSGTLSRLDWILSQDPDIVILEIGANDGLRGIETDLVEDNLDSILAKLEEEDVVTVFTGMKMVWNLGADYTSRFNAVFPRLAAKHDVIFMPFFLEDVAGENRFNQSDTIHPNEEGYRRIVENIYPYVIKAIGAVEKTPRSRQKEDQGK